MYQKARIWETGLGHVEIHQPRIVSNQPLGHQSTLSNHGNEGNVNQTATIFFDMFLPCNNRWRFSDFSSSLVLFSWPFWIRRKPWKSTGAGTLLRTERSWSDDTLDRPWKLEFPKRNWVFQPHLFRGKIADLWRVAVEHLSGDEKTTGPWKSQPGQQLGELLLLP